MFVGELLFPWQVSRLAVEPGLAPVGRQTAGGPLTKPSFNAEHFRFLVLCLFTADSLTLKTTEIPFPLQEATRAATVLWLVCDCLARPTGT